MTLLMSILGMVYRQMSVPHVLVAEEGGGGGWKVLADQYNAWCYLQSIRYLGRPCSRQLVVDHVWKQIGISSVSVCGVICACV